MGTHIIASSFLTSPIVEIIVGRGDDQTVLTAHQNLLEESPFLTKFVNKFESSGPVRRFPSCKNHCMEKLDTGLIDGQRRISLPDENVDAFGCFLQFQYTRDYTTAQSETPNESQQRSGEELLRHARIYTLADKLGLPALKSLAHSKIHHVKGTSSGELAYARYVYTHTPPTDTDIRKPVASYWAIEGPTLRHNVAEEWKKLCLEVPEFTFDVLTMVMDRKEKQSRSEVDAAVRGSARKRLRSGV